MTEFETPPGPMLRIEERELEAVCGGEWLRYFVSGHRPHFLH